MNYKCPICGNEDSKYIGYRNSLPYCRKCINFSGKKVTSSFKHSSNIKLTIDYQLSAEQESLAIKVRDNFINKKNCLIHAVTGAGKTELVYYTIEYALMNKLNVGFAIPRKDVVTDLYPRVQQAFKEAKVVYVVGEHTLLLQGDIILLTTHQLYRYENYFDLLIIDEIDAFPYKNNQILNNFALKSIRGNYILLSATPSSEDIKKIKENNGEVFTLMKRYHNSPLPVPRYLKPKIHIFISIYTELKRLLNRGKQVFVFVPTISIGKKLYIFLKYLIKDGKEVDSQVSQREEIISDFRKGRYKYLVTTSILERGVTVKGLQVIVTYADHTLYTKEALIQIAGRVGRKKDEREGEVIFIGNEENENIVSAIEEIKSINKKAFL